MRKGFVFCLAAILAVTCLSVFGASSAEGIDQGKSIVKVGEDVHVPAGARVESAVAIRGNVYVRGAVDEDVVAIMGDVRLYSTARVGGDAVAVGGRIIKDAEGVVGGDVVEVSVGEHVRGIMANISPYVGVMSIFGVIVFRLLLLLGFLGLAALLLSFMARHVGVVAARAEKSWWKALLWGLLGTILIVPSIVFLAITIIGIPLIFVVVIAISAAMALGYVAVADIVGKRIVKAAKKKKQSIFVETIIGLVVLFLVDLIPILGGIVRTAVVLIGFGAALTTKLGFDKGKK
jgi:hypothetical protein